MARRSGRRCCATSRRATARAARMPRITPGSFRCGRRHASSSCCATSRRAINGCRAVTKSPRRNPSGRAKTSTIRAVGNDQLDAQTSARLLKRALVIKGTREKQAEALGVHPHDLAVWLGGKAFPPQAIFEGVLEIILDEKKPAAHAALPGAQATPKRRVLVAESAQGYEVLAKVLGEEFTLVPVRTLTEGLDLLQNSVVARHHALDAIVCGQHFEGSQMLRFLECVKAYKATSGAEALRVGAQLKPDAAVLDIGMRDMSGYVLAERIRREPWGTAVTLIAVTGHGAPEDLERGREAGFAHHLMKPVTVEQLLEVLAKGPK